MIISNYDFLPFGNPCVIRQVHFLRWHTVCLENRRGEAGTGRWGRGVFILCCELLLMVSVLSPSMNHEEGSRW